MQARRIHHHKHRRQTAIGRADQPALGTVEYQRARRAALDAHLVFNAVTPHAIGLAIVQLLGHQEQ